MHERISVNSLCFPGARLDQVAAAWETLRPSRISFTSSLVSDDPRSSARVVRSGGYQVETIWHQFVDGHLDCERPALDGAQDRLSRLLEIAASLNASSVYLTTGGHGTLTWEEAAHRFATAVEPCRAEAADAGIELLVENIPSLRADLHIAHSLRDTITLAELAGIGICIDVNGCWVEAGLAELINEAMPRCHLVQLGDYVYGDREVPGRAVPGEGDIPLERIIGWVLEAGYQGGFDLELIGPRIDQAGHLEATARACQEVDRLLTELGV